MNLDELKAKSKGLKKTDFDKTHTGGTSRDAEGNAVKTGFDMFTPEHHRIMAIFEEYTESNGTMNWAGMISALPEYNLSLELLTTASPATAKGFAWNVTEGKYFSGAPEDAPVQLAKDMENTRNDRT